MEKELKSKRLNLLLKPSVHIAIGKIATINRKSMNQIINEALEFYVDINQRDVDRYNKFFNEEV